MILNLHEIANKYTVSYQYVSKKYNQFKINYKSTNNQPLKEVKKDHRKALQTPILEVFIKYLKYNPNQLKINRKSTNNQPKINRKSTNNQPINPNQKTVEKEEKENKMIKFLQQQLNEQKEELKNKNEQINNMQDMVKQQNQIIMATQKNMNDLLQQHNELKFTNTKKEDLIKQLKYDRKKTESSVKAISKLERTIEDALMTKRLKDGIEFSKQLMKEKKKQNIKK